MSFRIGFFGRPIGPMFSGPEEHAANGPDTWAIEKDKAANARNRWAVLDASGRTLDSYATKRDATQSRTDGVLRTAYDDDTRWYAGETLPGRRDHAAIIAEAAEAERTATRAAERVGTTPGEITEWENAIKGLDEELAGDAPGAGDEVGLARQDKRMEDALAAMRQMLALLTNGRTLDPDLLNEVEARALHHELTEQHGFRSSVEDHIHRIEYLGLDRDKSALDVLHDMRDEERDVVAVDEWRKLAS